MGVGGGRGEQGRGEERRRRRKGGREGEREGGREKRKSIYEEKEGRWSEGERGKRGEKGEKGGGVSKLKQGHYTCV